MAKRKKNGEGSVRKRKNGMWEGRLSLGSDENGKAIRKSVTAKTKVECIMKMEQLKKEQSTTSNYEPQMTFGKWMDFWYQTYVKHTLRESTQTTYTERIYKQIIPKIGQIPLKQLKTGTFEKFYAQLKANGRLIRREIYGEGLSNSVIRSIHAHCRAALDKAVE